MIFSETQLAGAFIVKREPFQDNRGAFARTFCQKEFSDSGLNPNLVQANIAHSRNRGITRGLHYQKSPFEEAKLVTCIKGRIYDVMVDLRKDSSSYGKWFGMELCDESPEMIYVPEGFAHGYQILEDDSTVLYFVSEYYSPAHESGIRWNDPSIDIKWPINDDLIISAKDLKWPDFQ